MFMMAESGGAGEGASQPVKKILSISGGGIRGIIPATILSHIEAVTGAPSHTTWDLIAGTSTGGIIACGLGAGIPASKLADMYVMRGAEIFHRPWWRRGLSMPRYPDTGINKVLADVFGAERYQNASTRLLVPAFDGLRYTTAHFKSWDCPPDLTNFDVCRATSSAPIYFPAYQGRYSDGGLFANDPSVNAYFQAKALWPTERIVMLSLGTGFKPGHASPPVNGGATEWIKPILSILMDGPADDVAFQCSVAMGEDYLHAQFALPSYVNPAMDDASERNAIALREFGVRQSFGGEILQFLIERIKS